MGSPLDEVLAVFGRAEALYPELIEKREYHAAELAKLDAAIAKLKHVAGAERVSAKAARPTKPKSTAATTPRNGASTIATLVLDALSSADGPVTASQLTSAISAKRPVSKANLQNVLRALRENGQIQASGPARRFSYSLTKNAAPAIRRELRASSATSTTRPGQRSPKNNTPSPKNGTRSNNGRSVREIILEAVAQPRSFAEIIAIVAKARPDVKKNSVGPILSTLRKDASVKASGSPRDYRYTRG
jgi:predicted transcriptional regulator